MTELTHFQLSVHEGIATVLMDRDGEPMNTLGPVIFDDFNTILDRLGPTIRSKPSSGDQPRRISWLARTFAGSPT